VDGDGRGPGVLRCEYYSEFWGVASISRDRAMKSPERGAMRTTLNHKALRKIQNQNPYTGTKMWIFHPNGITFSTGEEPVETY
jgi:hypothetical protein